ncbi:MAG: rhodanese-like domain-containing protein [Acidobacteria bacterium]|nr:rhodanese-like domain-containing protein [Acidobacteriota bacterium]
MSSKKNNTVREPRFSLVSETPAAEPEIARQHFFSKLAFEADVADLVYDLSKGRTDLIVVDTRSPQSYEECRIPGALNLPKIDEATTRDLPKDKLYVVYCWGPACNGSTKGAMKLAALGFRVKELIGGIEYWRRENCPVEGTLGEDAPLHWRFDRSQWKGAADRFQS